MEHLRGAQRVFAAAADPHSVADIFASVVACILPKPAKLLVSQGVC